MALAEVSRSLMPKFGAAEKESRLRSRQPMASSDAVEEVLGESKRVAKNDKEGKIVRIAMKRPEHCGFGAWFTDAVLHLGPNEQRRMEWGHLAPFTLGAFTKLFCRCHFEIVLLRKMPQCYDGRVIFLRCETQIGCATKALVARALCVEKEALMPFTCPRWQAFRLVLWRCTMPVTLVIFPHNFKAAALVSNARVCRIIKQLVHVGQRRNRQWYAEITRTDQQKQNKNEEESHGLHSVE